MSWTEQDHKSKTVIPMTKEREQHLEQEKNSVLPIIQKESEETKPFDPMKFQPVHSPGIYEAEFAVKDKDIIFHFWPWGYHEAERSNKTTPRFPSAFENALKLAMYESFKPDRVSAHSDIDMGSWFVRAKDWGENQFSRELAIKACEKVHKNMGGQS
jgi:hypothetical protein